MYISEKLGSVTDYYLNYSYLRIINCKPDVAVKSHIGSSAAIRGSSVVL